MNEAGIINTKVDKLYVAESRKIYGTLVRILGDMELAEESMHEAFSAALISWQATSLPENPVAWLISTAKFKGIDHLRRQQHLQQLMRIDVEQTEVDLPLHSDIDTINNDYLRLIFICCHPALAPQIQVALTLREVCGLTTEAIADAFFISPASLAQRIVRGKAKIRQARIPFEVPNNNQLADRIDSVLSVIYLVFNEGYTTSLNGTAAQVDLCQQAIHLAESVLALYQDAEVMGLLAMMLFHDARKHARRSKGGHIVLLQHQDRQRWNRTLIARAQQLVSHAMAMGNYGIYTLQAAIAREHAVAEHFADTNWNRIESLYLLMQQLEPSPVTALNHAVAVSYAQSPLAALKLLDNLAADHTLCKLHLFHCARADMLTRLSQNKEALAVLQHAHSLAPTLAEKELISCRIKELEKN
ncbi:RNA polymerase sigma factor [Alteromonas pelagimontana]|uniref:RNA polymerase sigma factor n=1 Tax=Alteromonas pelagimontana TaxID=1858656 RepID=A0A6M4MF10_9ALTE|nr:RNA polymerase sigma factor [Alteromonas pelagimontana]QJR81679.1 RNA polymerase sigma factor [Alteromonas pelagimontana]